MNPRYKVSTKWTSFPNELNEQIKAIFEDTFSDFLINKHTQAKSTIHVEGRIYNKEITLRVGISEPGRLKHLNFETSLDNTGKQEDFVNAVHLSIDAIGSLMTEYFQNDETHDIPYTWTETKFDDSMVWIQHSTENPQLESEADALLGITESAEAESLVIESEAASEDLLDATIEQFDEFAEEFESLLGQKPTLFGGGRTNNETDQETDKEKNSPMTTKKPKKGSLH